MAQITPPVGFNLFVLQGMTGRQLTYVARVTMPFFGLMIVALLILYFIPGIATWLPSQMFAQFITQVQQHFTWVIRIFHYGRDETVSSHILRWQVKLSV
ncbi:MAG: TRAP transporter large permease subunit [Betaproteobacteria bacterium]|nr:TRAP transporter large permease subunit [Betaproteobacteria bacterium]